MRDKIAKNGQNWPKFSVFDAKRGTSLKKVHQWWLIWAMQAWGTIKTELRCFTMGRVLLLSCTQPMSSLSSWQQSSSRVIRCRGVSLALRGHLCNYPRKLYKWLLATGWPCVLDGMSGIRGRSLFVQIMFKTFTYKKIRKKSSKIPLKVVMIALLFRMLSWQAQTRGRCAPTLIRSFSIQTMWWESPSNILSRYK